MVCSYISIQIGRVSYMKVKNIAFIKQISGKFPIMLTSVESSKNNVSSNINEVIRAVLNSLLFFLQKDFARTKSTKRTTSTKAQKRNQTKAQNATNEQKQKMRLKTSKGGKGHLFAYLRFWAFCAHEEKRIEKRR